MTNLEKITAAIAALPTTQLADLLDDCEIDELDSLYCYAIIHECECTKTCTCKECLMDWLAAPEPEAAPAGLAAAAHVTEVKTGVATASRSAARLRETDMKRLIPQAPAKSKKEIDAYNDGHTRPCVIWEDAAPASFDDPDAFREQRMKALSEAAGHLNRPKAQCSQAGPVFDGEERAGMVAWLRSLEAEGKYMTCRGYRGKVRVDNAGYTFDIVAPNGRTRTFAVSRVNRSEIK